MRTPPAPDVEADREAIAALVVGMFDAIADAIDRADPAPFSDEDLGASASWLADVLRRKVAAVQPTGEEGPPS